LNERTGLARWAPGLAVLLRYDPAWLAKDVAAGLSVAAIALPVGIAYADLTGVPAAVGIYAAIFPLVPYALFGSSRQLILGPDAATCIMVAASLAPLARGDPDRYLALLPVLTLITGALYVVAGFGRLGFFASFLSQPILTGYLNGIAIVIMVGQLPKLLGYPSGAGEVLPRLLEFIQRLGQSHLPTALLGLVLLAGLLALRRFAPNLPAALVVVVAGIAAVAAFDLQAKGVAVTGPVPAGLPTPTWTWFDPATYRSLFGDAAGILLISFTGGVLTAKSFARRNRYEIDANQELLALGAANLAVGLGQGFPVTGADSRTAVNDAMGGKSQLVGVLAAGAMLLVLLLLTGPLALVPTTALAAVILVSAAGLFDIPGLRLLGRMGWREGLMSVATTLGCSSWACSRASFWP
jgi:MFS superfamily sulfate permease-like transporter